MFIFQIKKKQSNFDPCAGSTQDVLPTLLMDEPPSSAAADVSTDPPSKGECEVAAAEDQEVDPVSKGESAVAAAEEELMDSADKKEDAEAFRRQQLQMRQDEKEKADLAKEEKKANAEPKAKAKAKAKAGAKAKAKAKGRPRKGAEPENAEEEEEEKPKRKRKTKEDKEENATKKRSPAAGNGGKAKKAKTGNYSEASEEMIAKLLELMHQYKDVAYDRHKDTLHKAPSPETVSIVPYFTRPACGLKIHLGDGAKTQKIYFSHSSYNTVAVHIQQCIYMMESMAEQDPAKLVEWCDSQQAVDLARKIHQSGFRAQEIFLEEIGES